MNIYELEKKVKYEIKVSPAKTERTE